MRLFAYPTPDITEIEHAWHRSMPVIGFGVGERATDGSCVVGVAIRLMCNTLSGTHVFQPPVRGVGRRCQCGAVETAARAEYKRRDAIRAQQCRESGCPCRGDLARHPRAVAEMTLYAAERAERAVYHAITEAERAVFAAQQVLAGHRARLAARVAAVARARAALDAVKDEAA